MLRNSLARLRCMCELLGATAEHALKPYAKKREQATDGDTKHRNPNAKTETGEPPCHATQRQVVHVDAVRAPLPIAPLRGLHPLSLFAARCAGLSNRALLGLAPTDPRLAHWRCPGQAALDLKP